jgi:LEA14-like dessication related protein
LYNVANSDKKSISDFSALDAANFLRLYNQKKMPAEFTLNLLVKNPNDGTQGTSKQLATISKLDWRLIIDDVNTINGVVNQSISVPGNSQETAIPIGISLDLLEFFNNKSYEVYLI